MPEQPDLATLRRVAEAATAGPWAEYLRSRRATSYWLTRVDADGDSIWTWPGFIETKFEADATYVATFNPQLVLSLLDEIDRLRKIEKIDAERTWWS